jgi:hypothetical protein
VLATAHPQTRYKLVDLGAFCGTYSFAFGINNPGDVARGAAPGQTDGFATTARLASSAALSR